MTREEKIAILKELKEGYWEDDGYGHETEHYIDVITVLDEAISALEQLPKYRKKYKRWKRKALEQKPCENAVSRDAVRQAIDEIYNCTENMEEYANSLDATIEKLPSVTRQTGEWIDDGFYAEGHSHKAFHCSKCGHNVLGFKEDLSNFCPNCGAEMESSDADSD